MIQHATWRVDVVDGVQAATDSRGAAPLVHSEWVRLLLGGFLAPARLCGTPEAPRVEYLVSGCDDVEDVPEAVRESMRAAVASDLACLRAALADHRARIRDAADQPDRFDAVLFLDAYELLMATTVSDDPKHWVLTDEGLCITCWGLAEGPRQRPLLTWSDAEVDRMQAEIEHRLGRLPPASAPDLGPKVAWDALRSAQVQAARRLSEPRSRRTVAAQPAPASVRPATAPSTLPAQRARALREWVVVGSATLACLGLLVWALVEDRGRGAAESEVSALRAEVDRTKSELRDARKNEAYLNKVVNEQRVFIDLLNKRQSAPAPAPGAGRPDGDRPPADGARVGGGSN